MKYQEINNPSSSLLCKEYKSNERNFQEIDGIRLSGLKKILDYSFPTRTIKITKNSKQSRYDIYLRKEGIDIKEVEKFRNFYGKGFHIILLLESDDNL